MCAACAADGSSEEKRRKGKNFQFLLHVGTRERMFASCWFVRDETQLILEGVGMADLGLCSETAGCQRPMGGQILAQLSHTHFPRSGLLHASSAGTRGRELTSEREEKIKIRLGLIDSLASPVVWG